MSSATNWDGFLKRRYGRFVNPQPSDNTIADFCEFVPQDRQGGENYNFPVALTHEHGFTPNVDNTAFSLNSAVDSTTKNAQLSGASIVVRGAIPYDMIAAAMHGAQDGGSGGSAYFGAVDRKIAALMEAGELYRELMLLYGAGTASAAAANIGVVNASVSGADLNATQVVNLTAASWAPGLWNNMINAVVDVLQSDATTVRASAVTVSAVAKATNRVSLYKSGSAVTVAAGDVIVVRDTRTKSCYGIQSILENSGSLFGISAATYAQWKALSQSVGGALDRAQILNVAGQLYSNGLRNGGKLFVGGPQFADLAEEAADLQRFNANTDMVKRQGASNLEYKTPAGNITVAVHTFMKQGIAMFLANDAAKRVGSTDLTFALPGTNKWFLQELADNAGIGLRIYSNQAPVIEMPYRCAILTGITSSGDTSPA